VRELENLMRRLAALYPQERSSREIIETELRRRATDRRRPASARADLTRIGRRWNAWGAISPSFGDDLPPPGLYDRVLAEVEAR
jgi:two-component system nitrogen regulation response regulator GlnG